MHCLDQLLVSEAPDSRCRALALSSAISHVGDWLNIVPSSILGLHLHDHEFRLCLQCWLGLPMVEEGSICPICLCAVDQFGDHQVWCGGNGDRIHRHDSVRDALFSAQTAALAPRKEVPLLIPGTRSRPADIFLPIWQRGQPAALDVTVILTLQQFTVEGAAVTQGYALAVGGKENELLMPPHTVQLESTSFHLSWSLWGDGVKRQQPPSPELVAC